MPNRIIKESIRTSKSVNALPDFEFRLWTYLITYVDDYGRGSADPELLKGLVFPRRRGLTEQQISKGVHNLATAGMITLYEVDGESYLQFPNWDKHQAIRAKQSKFPAPDSSLQADASICNQTLANVPVIQSNTIQSESESESNARTRAEAAFADFWAAYPKKVGKGAALKAFKKLKASAYPLLVPAIERQKQSTQWQKDGGQYIPNPATWLNQERWLDEGTDAQDGRPGYRAQPHNGTLGEYERAAVERLMQDG